MTRAVHTGQSFMDATIHLDGQEWHACSFLRCEIVYAGGDVTMIDCHFDACTFSVTDAAANTVALLKFMPAEMIAATFQTPRLPWAAVALLVALALGVAWIATT